MISVIIPTHNAEDNIKGLITSLQRQSVSSEVIVIDSSSSDRTVKIAESCGAKTIIIKKEDFDHGRTRNLAVAHSRGDILVFLTQDAFPADNYFLKNLIKPLEQPEIPASYGRQIPGADAKPPEKFARMFNYPEAFLIKGRDDIASLGIKTFFFSNVCSAVKRDAFEKVGGFADKVIVNEDMLLASRLILCGYKTAYVPDAMVIHSHDYSCLHQFKRYFDIGVFLKENFQILEYAKTENEGAVFFKEGIKYFLKNRNFVWLPYLVMETVSKYMGYKLGQHYTILPNSVRKKLSMHSHYWSNYG